MSAHLSENKALAAEISTVVESYLPTQFERSAAHNQLQDRIEAILNEGRMVNEDAESCEVTILLADIRGFTTLAETYSAKMIMDLLNRFFATMSAVVVRYGGTIDKLMGDSIMVLFGAPHAKSDDVERALACSIAMQHAMSEYNNQNKELGLPELFMGIGINTGEVVAGGLGCDQHREYTVIGDEVNLASRIEAQSLRGQVLISEASYKLAQSYILVGQSNSVQVKGKRKPVTLYELLGTTKPRTMTVPQREIRKSPRVSVNMPCYFQVVKGKNVKSQRCKAEVIDIGYHGLLILSPVPLENFSEIKMEVSLNLLGRETTDIFARVLLCESVGQGFRCGLEFTTADLAGQQSIKRFVDNMISG
jgi:adenylate cyclase